MSSCRIFDSDYHYPPSNIAIEETLRSWTDTDLVWFVTYTNSQSIIIGRNQAVEAERSAFAVENNIPAFRRSTGGGAVYHDAGNLNWAFIQTGTLEDRSHLLEQILTALHLLGLPIREGPRNGLYMGQTKIGGTASALSHGVLLFHGTLLVDSNLHRLRASLAAEQTGYKTQNRSEQNRQTGTASIPSPVANLSDYLPGLSVSAVKKALRETIRNRHRITNYYQPSLHFRSEIRKKAAIFRETDWVYRISNTDIDRKEHHESARNHG